MKPQKGEQIESLYNASGSAAATGVLQVVGTGT